MGTVYSKRTLKVKEIKEEMIFECAFPSDILIEILSFVPAKDLLGSCLLVCHEWNSLINGHGVWKRKCIRENKVVPSWTFGDIPLHYYRKIYLKNPFGRNLLKNPCGENGLTHFEFENGGNGWVVQNPPIGADPVPEEVGSQSCYATSFHPCSARQLIHLTRLEGVPEKIIDTLKPEITVGEWYAARFDCGCTYKLTVRLLNNDNACLDVFEFEYTETQWTGRAWSQVTHTFKDYPSGVRVVSFEHVGNDTQFWAGHYGSKMTGGFVKFKIK